MVGGLEDLFPGLRGRTYQIMSPRTSVYNCIAWAAEDTSNWWWPDPDEQDTWPAGVERAATLSAFQAAFSTLGYVVCDHAELEEAFEKVALFANPQGIPKHAARQLPSGRWTSKLGHLEDIEHDLHDIAGTEYGTVAFVMKRPIARG